MKSEHEPSDVASSPAILEYQRPAIPPTPWTNILGSTFVFALVHFAIDSILTFLAVVIKPPISDDPGTAAGVTHLRTDRFFFLLLVQAVIVVCISLLILLLQWGIWRARPVARPRNMARASVICAIVFTAITWIAWLIDREMDGSIVLLLMVLAGAATGILLGWRRISE